MDKNIVLNSVIQFGIPFREYAVEVYSQPEVERHCLELQNAFNANVDIMLWCCWLNEEDIHLSANWLDDVLVTIDSVSSQTVSKLREVRKVMMESGSFTKVQALSVKKHILNAELMIEKVLLQRLQDLTCRFLESKDYKNASVERKLDLEYYFEYINVNDARKNANLLLNACQRQSLEAHA